jgi:AraC-like DNA-binding protein
MRQIRIRDGRGRKEDLGEILGWKQASKPGRPCIVTKHGGINKCIDFINKTYCRPIQVNDLMKISGLSRSGLLKAFQKHIGASPGCVLRCVRLENAKRLLTEQDLKLSEIAKHCGFRSMNTFCVAFQRVTGTAPKKFQRQYWLATCRRHQLTEIRPAFSDHLLPSLPGENASTRSNRSKTNSTNRIL